MKPIDLVLDNVQKQVELSGYSDGDCVFVNDLSFTVKHSEYDTPTDANLSEAKVDFDWFLESARQGLCISHPNPDNSFIYKFFGSFSYPYGYEWNFRQLKQHLTSPDGWRRGILYNPIRASDPPCVVCYQFQVIKGLVNCTVTMRSSDVYKVLPQDVVMTRLLLEHVSNLLELPAGDMIFNIGNAHAYYTDMQFVEEFTYDWGD